MKFGITNLAWEEKDIFLIEDQLKKFDYLETVFSRRSGGTYYSTQSIFYGSDIKSFDDENILDYLNYVIDECFKCGIQIIVFGSAGVGRYD